MSRGEIARAGQKISAYSFWRIEYSYTCGGAEFGITSMFTRRYMIELGSIAVTLTRTVDGEDF